MDFIREKPRRKIISFVGEEKIIYFPALHQPFFRFDSKRVLLLLGLWFSYASVLLPSATSQTQSLKNSRRTPEKPALLQPVGLRGKCLGGQSISQLERNAHSQRGLDDSHLPTQDFSNDLMNALRTKLCMGNDGVLVSESPCCYLTTRSTNL